MTLVVLCGLYVLGAVLMGRRFHALAGLQLSDEPGPTVERPPVPLVAAAFWPLVVVALVCADTWVAIAHRPQR